MANRVRSETFYVTQRRFDRDVIDVFVIRYTFDGPGRAVRAKHRTAAGWIDHDEGVVVEPAVTIPGDLAYLLAHTDPYDTSPEVAAVESLIARVLGR